MQRIEMLAEEFAGLDLRACKQSAVAEALFKLYAQGSSSEATEEVVISTLRGEEEPNSVLNKVLTDTGGGIDVIMSIDPSTNKASLKIHTKLTRPLYSSTRILESDPAIPVSDARVAFPETSSKIELTSTFIYSEQQASYIKTHPKPISEYIHYIPLSEN